MKRFLGILLCTALLLAGCTTKIPTETMPPEPTTVAPTTLPEPTTVPAPTTADAVALADKTCVLLTTLERDATVQVVGSHEADYYIVKLGESYGLVEKALIRLESETAYAQWNGFAHSNAVVYDNYQLLGEGVQTLKMNAQVQVLADVGCCLVVQVGELVGYMRTDSVSKTAIQPGGGGSADGGDISLQAAIVRLSSFVTQGDEELGAGAVLVDQAEVIFGWFDRGQTVPVITEDGFAEEKDGWAAVYVNGVYGYVRRVLLRMDGQEAFAPWEGYSTAKAALYDNYYLNGAPLEYLPANGKIQVLEDLGGCFLVTYGQTTGYLAKANASENYINYGNGGGGDWTPPAL